MELDKMQICQKCGSDASYLTQINETIENKMCYGCGFWSNSLMKKGEDFYNEQMEILPELYKELAWEDEKTKEIFIPSTINIPELGMIFANGSSKNDWKWAAVKAMDIPQEDRYKYPNPHIKGEFYSRKMDMSTLKEFPAIEGYVDAMEYIDVFKNINN